MLKKYDGKKQGWLRQGKELAVFIILMFVVFRFIIGVSLVNGSSMTPSLKNGDVVVYTRCLLYTSMEISPGSIGSPAGIKHRESLPAISR